MMSMKDKNSVTLIFSNGQPPRDRQFYSIVVGQTPFHTRRTISTTADLVR